MSALGHDRRGAVTSGAVDRLTEVTVEAMALVVRHRCSTCSHEDTSQQSSKAPSAPTRLPEPGHSWFRDLADRK